MSDTDGAAPRIRRAESHELPAIADTLAAAFINYSWARWTVPGSEHDRPRLRNPAATLTPADWDRIALLHGTDGSARIEQHEQAAAPLRPHHDCTLTTVGTHPGYRGRGYGAAVIGVGLRDLDAHLGTCLLETSTDHNIPLYHRLRFQTVATVSAITGSPPVTIMLRRPSGAAS